jgi:thiol-disulfide isomerase/thioredoxin
VPRLKRPRRKAVVLTATACAGVLAVVLAVTAFSGGGDGVTYVDGNTNAVLYGSGHRSVAPAFSGTTLTGTQLSSSAYRGKVVVVNFWGSWCVPCRSEAATLAVVAEQYRSKGVSFVGIDVRDNTSSAVAFTTSHDVSYPSISDPGSTITLDFSTVVPLSSTPTTVVIDKTGHVAGAVFGQATYGELTAMLSKVTSS